MGSGTYADAVPHAARLSAFRIGAASPWFRRSRPRRRGSPPASLQVSARIQEIAGFTQKIAETAVNSEEAANRPLGSASTLQETSRWFEVSPT
jgi:hypothetical protein